MLIKKKQITETESKYEILKDYLFSNYKNRTMIVIDTKKDIKALSWLNAHIPKIEDNGMSICNDYIFIEFKDRNKAINFCNYMPDSLLYSLVWEKNQIVHTNS